MSIFVIKDLPYVVNDDTYFYVPLDGSIEDKGPNSFSISDTGGQFYNVTVGGRKCYGGGFTINSTKTIPYASNMEFTLSFWLRAYSETKSVFKFPKSGSYIDSYDLMNADSYGKSHRYTFYTSSWNYLYGPRPYTNGKWYNVIITHNSADTYARKLYVNGGTVASSSMMNTGVKQLIQGSYVVGYQSNLNIRTAEIIMETKGRDYTKVSNYFNDTKSLFGY